jgi:hypothetical protein
MGPGGRGRIAMEPFTELGPLWISLRSGQPAMVSAIWTST